MSLEIGVLLAVGWLLIQTARQCLDSPFPVSCAAQLGVPILLEESRQRGGISARRALCGRHITTL